MTVRHGKSETVCDTVHCALGMRVLGAAVDGDGYLEVDSHQCTSVPGLFAAGDVSSGLNQISVAARGAAIAAAAMHQALRAKSSSGPAR